MTTLLKAPLHVARRTQPARRRLRIGLFGCALDTGNRGVSALAVSTLDGLSRQEDAPEVTLFDHTRGASEVEVALGPDRSVRVRRVGCYHSRRYYRPDNLAQVRWAARLGARRLHPMARLLAGFDAILDISGGDSFADIYGLWRYRSTALPKLIALELGVPLVLLPQTYGPYRSDAVRATTRHILANARRAWARDALSLGVMQEVLGDRFDPSRHLSGVDVAFGLQPVRPRAQIVDEVESLRAGSEMIVGLNVSGLLYNAPGVDRSQYGFRSSYGEIVDELLSRLVAMKGVGVLLVPHVVATGTPQDCDASALPTIYEKIPSADRSRVRVLPNDLSASETKWAIGQTDWFCGTRMHACIGAISQGVPTLAVAYSDKTRGVFATAGVGSCVVDPRRESADEIVSRAIYALYDRNTAAAQLAETLPRVRERLEEQFAEFVTSLSTRGA